ncbi:hypothetical protein QBC40DRAFT_326308 [Triangularia verruculosa]|uniref:Uncharacterized protein n=1 Tax=Triangularia verruculosa TaxID=2587418 RepID=A0AAN7AVA3_9PEZI|nr:hypothetical protein QBC40DRAFT_326308 [Triangularia verruculosa]
MSSAADPRVPRQGQQQVAKGSVSRKPVPTGDEVGESSAAQPGPRRAPSRQQRPQQQQQQQSMAPTSTEEGARLPRTVMRQESTATRGRQRSAGPRRGMPRQPSTQGSNRQPVPGRAAENVIEASSTSRREPAEGAPERPAALSTQQRRPNQGPPASARNQVSPDQAAPNFSFPKPPAEREPAQAETQASQTTSRRGPPRGPLPSAPVAAVQGSSRQGPPIPAEALPVPQGPVPPVPTSSRSGQAQTARAEQAVPVILRPSRQQTTAPAQSFEQPQTSRRNMRQGRNPAYPPPLRTANLAPNPPQQTSMSAGGFSQTPDHLVSPQSALPQATYNPHVSAETSRPRNVVSPSKSPQPPAGSFSRKPVNSPPHQMMMNVNPLRSSPPNPPPPPANSSLPTGFSRNTGMDPLRQSPPNPPQKPVMSSNFSQQNINPLRQSPPNPQVSDGGMPAGLFSQNPSAPPRRPVLASQPQRKEVAPLNITTSSSRNLPTAYSSGPSRASPPRVTSPPQGGYLSRNITSPSSSNQDGGRYPTMPRAVVSPPYQPPKQAYNQHSHSNSLDSIASSATATSTRPLNPTIQPSSSFSPPTRKNTDLSYSKPLYNTAPPQTPYMSILLSLDKIPRLHNILSTFFLFLLLVGFIIIPGSFTSSTRPPSDPDSAIPINLGSNTSPDKKLLLTKANTATMVVGFVFIIVGTFGTAWLGLKWRRNYVWLLNKLYLPLVMYSVVGLVGTVVGVYAVQGGEWSTQAIIAGILEAVEGVVGGLCFGVYNVWLVQRVRQEEGGQQRGGGGKGGYTEEKKQKKKKKRGWGRRGGLMGRWRGWRGKRSIAVGSVV